MERKTILLNEYVKVVRTDDGFSFYDLTDKCNGYSGYTKGKIGIEKTEKYIIGLAPVVKSKVKMGDIVGLMTTMNLKPHTYCAVD